MQDTIPAEIAGQQRDAVTAFASVGGGGMFGDLAPRGMALRFPYPPDPVLPGLCLSHYMRALQRPDACAVDLISAALA